MLDEVIKIELFYDAKVIGVGHELYFWLVDLYIADKFVDNQVEKFWAPGDTLRQATLGGEVLAIDLYVLVVNRPCQ